MIQKIQANGTGIARLVWNEKCEEETFFESAVVQVIPLNQCIDSYMGTSSIYKCVLGTSNRKNKEKPANFGTGFELPKPTQRNARLEIRTFKDSKCKIQRVSQILFQGNCFPTADGSSKFESFTETYANVRVFKESGCIGTSAIQKSPASKLNGCFYDPYTKLYYNSKVSEWKVVKPTFLKSNQIQGISKPRINSTIPKVLKNLKNNKLVPPKSTPVSSINEIVPQVSSKIVANSGEVKSFTDSKSSAVSSVVSVAVVFAGVLLAIPF